MTIDFQKYELENDPTYFSEVLRRYQDIMELLLELPTSEILDGIDQEDLNIFRRAYADSSYVCRYRRCPRASNGFHSRQAREAHEALHIKRFKCTDATCEFYIVGFATKAALQKHDRIYHSKPDENDVPRFPQKALHNLHESRHEDLTSGYLSPKTVPTEQALPAQVMLIRPEEIFLLPNLSDPLRQYYADLAQNCWDVIEKRHEPWPAIPYFDPSTAQQQLHDLTLKIRGDLRIYQAGNDLSKLTLADLPSHLKQEGDDWHAVFNPRIPRTLDVKSLKTFQHDSAVFDVAFSQDGMLIATGSDSLARVFTVFTWIQVCLLRHKSSDIAYNYVRGVCFSPDGRSLATGSDDSEIKVWNLNRQKIQRTLVGHESAIYQLAWFKDGGTIASGSNDRTIRFWDPETGHCRKIISAADAIASLSVSSDGEYVAAGCLDRFAYVWECKSGLLKTRFDSHKDSVYSVAFSPDGKSVIGGSLDGTVKIWAFDETSNSSCLATLTGHANSVLSVQFTQDGAWILSGSKDKGVHFWDPKSGDTQVRVEGHATSGTVPMCPLRLWVPKVLINRTVIILACSPTHSIFATAGGDMKARVWSYQGVSKQQPQPPKFY